MKDKYDEAIEYLTEHPEHISTAWSVPDDGTHQKIVQAHCLFQHVGEYGCLTQIRLDPDCFGIFDNDALTNEIARDERIPTTDSDITIKHLPVFAEWQRRLDKELNRTEAK
jgi:hypothetical protein